MKQNIIGDTMSPQKRKAKFNEITESPSMYFATVVVMTLAGLLWGVILCTI